jgi:hypothetical protein
LIENQVEQETEIVDRIEFLISIGPKNLSEYKALFLSLKDLFKAFAFSLFKDKKSFMEIKKLKISENNYFLLLPFNDEKLRELYVQAAPFLTDLDNENVSFLNVVTREVIVLRFMQRRNNYKFSREEITINLVPKKKDLF